MKASIQIQNLKCGGCETKIINALSKIDGLEVEEVRHDDSTIYMIVEDKSAINKARILLAKLGYPEFGKDNPLSSKAKSYISCAIGRVENKLA